MQVREPRMDDNRASAADNLRKISPSCVGSEKFFSTVVSYEKFNFRLFHCVQPTKIITFRTRQHHTTQESGGVWFFIAATPKHHDQKSIGRNIGTHTKRTAHFLAKHYYTYLRLKVPLSSVLCEEVAGDAGTCRRYVRLLKLGRSLGAMLKSASGHVVAVEKQEAGETCSSDGLGEMP